MSAPGRKDSTLVAVDSIAAAEAMTEHLVSLGRARVAAIGREPAAGTASVRLQGYRQALQTAGLVYVRQLVVGVPQYDRADGRRAMQKLPALPDPPDAVFCFNDLMAIGALRACAEAGISVPDQIPIAGFDDIAEGRFSNPTLTTISPDLTVLSKAALTLLIDRIDEKRDTAEAVKVPWTLEVRKSTAGRATAGDRLAGGRRTETQVSIASKRP